MQPLGESWDVVEVVRSLVTEVDSLQKIVAGQEARLQVLEGAPRPLIHRWVTWSRSLRTDGGAARQEGVKWKGGEVGEGRRAKRSFAQFRTVSQVFPPVRCGGEHGDLDSGCRGSGWRCCS